MANLRQHKDIKYSKNMSSYQIWTTLNNLIYEAAAPLCAYGNMSIETGLSCLVLSTNNRRKVTPENADVLIGQLFSELAQSITTNNRADSNIVLLNSLLSRGLERNILIDHIVYSLNHFKSRAIDSYKLRRHVDLYLKQYELFKRDVMMRYYYMAENFANKNWELKREAGLKTTKADMLHVYVISCMRAIDKFAPFEGTLTSYIQRWFQNAQGSSDFMVFDGEAFDLNRAVRKSVQEGDKQINNKAIPIEDRQHTIAAAEVEDETFSDFSHHIARLPNACLVFLAQAIPYTLNPDQIKRIEIANKATKPVATEQ